MSKSKNASSSKCKRLGRFSIRWKLAVYMAVFVAVILVITWLFQVFLLNLFFYSVKKAEMKNAAKNLEQQLDSSDFEKAVYREAIDHTLCIMIYRIDGEEGAKKIANVDATGSNVIMTLDNDRLVYFFEKAEENGSACFSKVAFGGMEVNSDAFFDSMHYNDESGRPIRVPSQNVRLVYVLLSQDSENGQYMILLDASMQPLNSTVQTLSMQYIWIAAITLFIAVIAVFVFYRRISKPLISMNESAKQLAKGNYNVTFSGEGYRETHELADTLNYATHELSQLDALQKELIANISHDLRTPLTMIRGYGEIMRDLPDENTPENMQVIIDEATRLSELVDDLLDLSKIQSGAYEPKRSVFDLTEAVHEVMNRYDVLIKHRGYHVNFSADCSVCVYADRSMLLQVIYNLINNAVNYTGEDKSVTVVQSVTEKKVRISVIDTGKGIKPEDLPLIWNRYYKVDKVHRMATIGTGLGLSIVKGILEAHGAGYGVISKEGAGSTFWFELPVQDESEHTT